MLRILYFITHYLPSALSREGKKVIHLDANAHYGDNIATLSLDQLTDALKTPCKISQCEDVSGENVRFSFSLT